MVDELVLILTFTIVYTAPCAVEMGGYIYEPSRLNELKIIEVSTYIVIGCFLAGGAPTGAVNSMLMNLFIRGG